MRQLLIFLISLLFGCTIAPDKNQLTIVLSGDPKNLDPAHATDVRSGQVTAFMYDNEIRFLYQTKRNKLYKFK